MALNLAGKTVLVVDDESFSRVTVGHLLEEMGQPRVVHADDGRAALEILKAGEFRIDMIICDFNMPNMHGLDFLKTIRTGNGNIARYVPFAMLTGYADKDLVDMALALDANAFVIKPISKNALEARLLKMLRLVLSDNWLKSEADYAGVDVSSALEDIVGITDPASRPASAKGVFVMRKDQPLFRNPMGTGVFQDEDLRGHDDVRAHQLEDEALGLDDSQPEGETRAKQGVGHLCPLDRIPVNAVLARDVHTADGRLFMHAGSHVSERVISILHDLQELGHPVDGVWITEKPG